MPKPTCLEDGYEYRVKKIFGVLREICSYEQSELTFPKWVEEHPKEVSVAFLNDVETYMGRKRRMSYDIELVCPVSGEVLESESVHQISGGTYCLGGTKKLCLNITYNYGSIFRKVIDKDSGIRSIYGKSGADSIPIIQAAINQLGNDIDDDYWKPTEGNAKAALCGLLALAKMRPDGIWMGD